ncbi:MAG: translocation/assembly module TamB domain-containing protein [Pseudomonadota bacterium]
MNPKQILKGLAKYTAYVSGSFLLTMTVLFFVLQTGFAKSKIATSLSGALSGPDRRVTMGELEGIIPFKWRFSRISVADMNGEWLILRELRLRWSPLALLQGKIDVKEISARELVVARIPVERKKEPWKAPSLPKDLPPLEVTRIAIARFVVAKPVLGQEGVFGIRGRVRGTGSRLILPLMITRKDGGPETNFGITIALCEETSSLGINAVLREDEGGFAAAVLGLKNAGPLLLKLKGAGPLTSWAGRFFAAARNLGSVHAGIGLAVAGEIKADVEGCVVPAAAVLPKGLKPLLLTGNNFAIRVSLIPDEKLLVRGAELRAENYSAEIKGMLDIKSGQVQSDFVLEVEDLATFSTLVGMPVGGEIAVSGELSGTIRRPELNANIELTGLKLQKMIIQEVRTGLKVSPKGPVSSEFSEMEMKSDGALLGMSTSDKEPLPLDSLKWLMNVRIFSRGPFIMDGFRITGNDIAFNMAGQVFPSDWSGNLSASLAVGDLRPFTSYLGKRVSGALYTEAQITGNFYTGTASGEVDGYTSQLGGLPEPLSGLIAPKTSFCGIFDVRKAERLAVPYLCVENCLFSFFSQLGLDFREETISGNWQLRLPRAEAVPVAQAQGLSGELEAQGRMYGSFYDFDAGMALKGENVQIRGTGFQMISADVEARGLPDDPAGSLALILDQSDQSLTVSSGFSLREKTLKLSGLSLLAPKNRVSGDLVLFMEGPLVHGHLEGEFEELSVLGRFFGADLAGRAALHADFNSESGRQDAAVTVRGEDLDLPFGEISKIELSSDVKNLFGVPQGRLVLSLQDLQARQVEITGLDFEAEGTEESGSFHLAARGQRPHDFAVETAGIFYLSEKTKQFRLDRMQAHFADYPVRLLQPAAVTRSAEELSLDRLGLAIGPGYLYASGRVDKSVSLAVSLQDLPLGISQLFWEPGLEGSLNGELRLEGDLSHPHADAELLITGVSPVGEDEKALISELSAGIDLAAGRLSIDVDMREKNGLAEMNFEVPVEFSLDPFVFSLPAAGRIYGNINALFDLNAITPFIPQENEISGLIAADLDIQGTVANPEVVGNAGVENGSFQNLTTGTVLHNVQMQITARGPAITIESMRATDGENGVVTGRGVVNFARGTGFPVEFGLDFNRATLVRRDEITGTMSGGVTMAGPVGKMDISGRIRVDRAEISLERGLPPDVPELEVIEVGGPGEKIEEKAREGPSPFNPGLNLQVSFPAQIFVRGRGLESEWEGDLDISGSLEKPVITGSINVIRGNFVFLDKRFDLAKGTIQFFGATPPAPVIDVLAEAKGKEMTALVALTGPVSKPSIELRSEPPLPTDEVLSRLLFGEGIAGITPIQALRLASALNTLRGGGGGLDILAKTRRLIGVEELELKQSEEGPAVAVGKYLGEGIRVGVEQGLGSATGKVAIEVEATPDISLETETGLNTRSGLGINWKREY